MEPVEFSAGHVRKFGWMVGLCQFWLKTHLTFDPCVFPHPPTHSNAEEEISRAVWWAGWCGCSNGHNQADAPKGRFNTTRSKRVSVGWVVAFRMSGRKKCLLLGACVMNRW